MQLFGLTEVCYELMIGIALHSYSMRKIQLLRYLHDWTNTSIALSFMSASSQHVYLPFARYSQACLYCRHMVQEKCQALALPSVIDHWLSMDQRPDICSKQTRTWSYRVWTPRRGPTAVPVGPSLAVRVTSTRTRGVRTVYCTIKEVS